jgi:chromosome segregation ATPase
MNLREELELFKAGNASLVKANEKLRARVVELETEYEALCYCCDAIRELHDRMHDQYAEIRENNCGLREQVQSLKDELDATRKDRDAIRDHRDRLNDQNAELSGRVNLLERHTRILDRDRLDLFNVIKQLRERVEELLEEIDDYEGNDYFALYEAAKKEADDAIADRHNYREALKSVLGGKRMEFNHKIATDVLESMFHIAISDIYSNALGDISIAGRELH